MNQDEMMIPPGVAVYGASSDLIPSAFLDAARLTGELLARAGVPLVCGGGRGGVMAAAIEGCVSHGGVAVGVLPQFMIDREWNHPALTHLIVTDGMHSRKERMAELSRGAIAMPGGVGTLDELFEIVTWRQLHLYNHPVVLCNLDGYYDPLRGMLDNAERLGFMRPGQPDRLLHICTGAAEAVNHILNHKD